MPTIWEMVRDYFKKPLYRQIKNPLGINLNSTLKIDVLDYRDRTFVLKQIRQYNHEIGGNNLSFVDYKLESSSLALDGEDWEIILRYNEVEKTDKVLLLYLSHEHGYEKELVDSLLEKNEFEMYYDDRTEVFHRIHDVSKPYSAKVLQIDENNFNDKNLEKQNYLELTYWDYLRSNVDEANQEYHEFLFVEKNKSNGWFQFWRGFELSSNKINVLTK